MFNPLSHLAKWHATPDQGPTPNPPPQAGLLSRLTRLARQSQASNPSSPLDLHDALDLDLETRTTILCHRLRNV